MYRSSALCRKCYNMMYTPRQRSSEFAMALILYGTDNNGRTSPINRRVCLGPVFESRFSVMVYSLRVWIKNRHAYNMTIHIYVFTKRYKTLPTYLFFFLIFSYLPRIFLAYFFPPAYDIPNRA